MVISWEDVVKIIILVAAWWVTAYIFVTAAFHRMRELMGYN